MWGPSSECILRLVTVCQHRRKHPSVHTEGLDDHWEGHIRTWKKLYSILQNRFGMVHFRYVYGDIGPQYNEEWDSFAKEVHKVHKGVWGTTKELWQECNSACDSNVDPKTKRPSRRPFASQPPALHG